MPWNFPSAEKSKGAFHLAAAQATGANRHAHWSSSDVYAYLLRVRRPGSAGFPVGMAHIVAGNDALMAYLAKFSHI